MAQTQTWLLFVEVTPRVFRAVGTYPTQDDALIAVAYDYNDLRYSIVPERIFDAQARIPTDPPCHFGPPQWGRLESGS